jgi:predicted negative regulator of RcsB-dependent stress response
MQVSLLALSDRLLASSLSILSVPLLLFGLCAASLPASAQNRQESEATLSVRVHDVHQENPLEQARVELLRFPDSLIAQQFTDSSGTTTFTGFPRGSYIVRAAHTGYHANEISVDFQRGDTMKSADIGLFPVEKDHPDRPGSSVTVQDLKIPENARKKFERGMKLLNEKKEPRESIAAFEKATELFPNYSDAFLLLGTAHLQLGEAGPAEESLRKVLTLDPRTTLPHYPLAVLLFSQKRYDEERKLLMDARELDNKNWRWPFELARCEAQQAHWEPALQYALASSNLPGVATKVHLLLGDIYSNTGRIKEAIRELELFVQLDAQSSYVARTNQVLLELRRQLSSNESIRPQ